MIRAWQLHSEDLDKETGENFDRDRQAPHDVGKNRSLKRKRDARAIIKRNLLLPEVLDEHRAIECRCPQKKCPSKIAEDVQFTLRRNLQRMSQTEEAEWRRQRLLPAAQMPASERRVTLSAVQLCVFGFACIVGGPTYERVCYATLRELRDAGCHEGDPALTSKERTGMLRDLRDDSFLKLDIKELLSFIVGVLVDYDPVTGQMQLDSIEFPEILELYRSMEVDSIRVPSDSYVRAVWSELVEEQNISIRDRKTVSKCDRCIELRSLIRKSKLSDKVPLKKAILNHKTDIMAARQAYHGRRNRARFDGGTYASLIVDAMDQV